MIALLRPLTACIVALAVLLSACSRELARAESRDGTRVYDELHSAFAPYLDRSNDDRAFAIKARSLVSNPYKFWRGSKDLYFAWCKTHASDWLNDRDAFVPSHGDLHFGNIGTYTTEQRIGRLAFGEVDFDDSAVLPFQVELLSGAVTLRLVAQQSKLEWNDDAIDSMLDAYSEVIKGNEPGIDPFVKQLFDAEKAAYSAEIDAFTSGGKFKSVIRNAKGKLAESLTPAVERKDAIADALAAVASRSQRAQRVFRIRTAEEFRDAIRDVALRTRMNSSGSQGQTKLLILIGGGAMKDIDGDAILYLKQQIPAAAERSGAIPRVAQSPAERSVAMSSQLTSPRPYLNEACEIGGQSFVLQLKEPWSNELDAANVKSRDDLLHFARIWGDVAGRAHRTAGLRPAIVDPRFGRDLHQILIQRSHEYVDSLLQDFEDFRSDPRTIRLVGAADRYVQQLETSR